jgi:hypothetical protein
MGISVKQVAARGKIWYQTVNTVVRILREEWHMVNIGYKYSSQKLTRK